VSYCLLDYLHTLTPGLLFVARGTLGMWGYYCFAATSFNKVAAFFQLVAYLYPVWIAEYLQLGFLREAEDYTGVFFPDCLTASGGRLGYSLGIAFGPEALQVGYTFLEKFLSLFGIRYPLGGQPLRRLARHAACVVASWHFFMNCFDFFRPSSRARR